MPLGRLTSGNVTTAGFLFFMTVLGLAARGRWGVGATASLVATPCFNTMSLEPV